MKQLVLNPRLLGTKCLQMIIQGYKIKLSEVQLNCYKTDRVISSLDEPSNSTQLIQIISLIL